LHEKDHVTPGERAQATLNSLFPAPCFPLPTFDAGFRLEKAVEEKSSRFVAIGLAGRSNGCGIGFRFVDAPRTLSIRIPP
jgi:hypothetical protein